MVAAKIPFAVARLAVSTLRLAPPAHSEAVPLSSVAVDLIGATNGASLVER